jgi:uncharacterized membrane protein
MSVAGKLFQEKDGFTGWIGRDIITSQKPKIKLRNFLDYKRWIKLFKLLFWETIRIVEHNPEHFTKISILNQEIKACSRCLGIYVALAIFTPIFAYLYHIKIELSFWFVFITSIALGSVTLLDWLTVSFKIRNGNNNIRIFAGFLLGISATFYLWLLPESWWFKLITLMLYTLMAILLAIIVNRKQIN